MVHHVDKLLNEEDNNLLLAPFQIEEIQEGYFSHVQWQILGPKLVELDIL